MSVLNLLMWDENRREMDQLSNFFNSNGFPTTTVDEFQELSDRILIEKPALVLLSIDHSIKKGLELCQSLKSQKLTENIFVVFMTKRREDEVQVLSLEAGADDFLCMPIPQRLFLRRINALLKRKKVSESQPDAQKFIIDRERYLVISNGQEFYLPKKEFQILSLLYSKPGKVFSRDEIKRFVWEDFSQVRVRTVDVHIRKIREAIGEDRILTIKGEGYRFHVA